MPAVPSQVSLSQPLIPVLRAALPHIQDDADRLMHRTLDDLHHLLRQGREEADKESTQRIAVAGLKPPRNQTLAKYPFALTAIGYGKIQKAASRVFGDLLTQDVADIAIRSDRILAGIVSDAAGQTQGARGAEYLVKRVKEYIEKADTVPHFNNWQEFSKFVLALNRKIPEILTEYLETHTKDTKPEDLIEQISNDLSCTLNISLRYPDGTTFKIFNGNGYGFNNFHPEFFGQPDDRNIVQSFPAFALLCSPHTSHPDLNAFRDQTTYLNSLRPSPYICFTNNHSILGSDGLSQTDLLPLTETKKAHFPLGQLIRYGHSPEEISQAVSLWHLLCLADECLRETDSHRIERLYTIGEKIAGDLRSKDGAKYRGLTRFTNGRESHFQLKILALLSIHCLDAFSDTILSVRQGKELHPVQDDIGLVVFPPAEADDETY